MPLAPEQTELLLPVTLHHPPFLDTTVHLVRKLKQPRVASEEVDGTAYAGRGVEGSTAPGDGSPSGLLRPAVLPPLRRHGPSPGGGSGGGHHMAGPM